MSGSFSFGDNAMEDEVRQLAADYAAALQRILDDAYAEAAGHPAAAVEALVADRVADAGIPLDRDELTAHAAAISNGERVVLDQG
jgi:hypothetical protein